jgi:hypothetical protein
MKGERKIREMERKENDCMTGDVNHGKRVLSSQDDEVL